VELARGLLTEAGIKRDDLDNFDCGDAKFLGHPFNGLRTDETVTMLDFVKKRKHSRAALVIGILCDALIGRFFESRSNLELRKMNHARGDWRVDILFKNGEHRTDVFHGTAVNKARLWDFAIVRGAGGDVTQLRSIDRARAGGFNFRTHREKKSGWKN